APANRPAAGDVHGPQGRGALRAAAAGRARRRVRRADQPAGRRGAAARADALRARLPRRGATPMSTATSVPETFELEGDDALRTLRRTGLLRLLRDSYLRFRYADGFS